MTNGQPRTPRTKTEFVEQYADQLAGFLLSAFAHDEAVKVDMAAKGRFMQQRLVSVRPLLEKMYDFIANEPITLPAVPEPSMNDQVNALLRKVGTLGSEQRKLVADKLAKAFAVKEKA